MADRFIFADEAGNFDFSRGPSASKYFILTTVTIDDPSVGLELIRLRHKLLAEGDPTARPNFHASEDTQKVRDRVFPVLAAHSMSIDSTILEKSKAQPHIRASHQAFYQFAWYYHLKNLAPRIIASGDRMVIVAASLGEKKKQAAFRQAVESVARQIDGKSARTAFWSASCDPCLQVADYCSWAIQRRWERGDARSWKIIQPKIRSEYDLWSVGSTHYY